MTGRAAATARAAAIILAPDLGPDLPAEVEAAIHARDTSGQRADQYDPLVIAGLGISAASLIVSIAQLAWSIYADQRKHIPQPTPEAIVGEVRITLRDQDTALPPPTERIIEIIATETIRLAGPAQ